MMYVKITHDMQNEPRMRVKNVCEETKDFTVKVSF